MRAALLASALIASVLTVPIIPAPAQTVTCAKSDRLCRHAAVGTLHRHSARLRRHARPYHIPRFDQGEAEAYVHTVYPYRTGLYVPWPDAYGAPYPY